MLDALTAAMPDIVTQIANFLRAASPAFLIIIGAILFLFSGAVKVLAKVVGAGMVIYGLLILFGYL